MPVKSCSTLSPFPRKPVGKIYKIPPDKDASNDKQHINTKIIEPPTTVANFDSYHNSIDILQPSHKTKIQYEKCLKHLDPATHSNSIRFDPLKHLSTASDQIDSVQRKHNMELLTLSGLGKLSNNPALVKTAKNTILLPPNSATQPTNHVAMIELEKNISAPQNPAPFLPNTHSATNPLSLKAILMRP